MRQVAHRGRKVTLGWSVTRHATLCDERIDPVARDLLAAGGQRRDRAVVARRDVPRALWLGDLRVVQLGGVVVDVQHPGADRLQWLHGQVVQDLRT